MRLAQPASQLVVEAELATLRTPDGHGRVELTKYLTPTAITPDPNPAPVNTLGIGRIMFAVDDIDADV